MSIAGNDNRRAVVYARFSTDKQSNHSIADQLRECRDHAVKNGLTIVAEHFDHAISGASVLNRSGLSAALEAVKLNSADALLVFSQDRLSRDLADTAVLYKQLDYYRCALISVTEGEIRSLDMGMRALIAQEDLRKIAVNTKRGQRGRIKVGKHAGGHCFGYQVVPAPDGDGSMIKVDDAQAAVVIEIMERYANGESPKKIAEDLNMRAVPGPSHGKKCAQNTDGKSQWAQSTINGDRKAGTGILNNERYIGRVIYNRVSTRKNPQTGKNEKQFNPEEEWTITECPEQRILSDELWDRVKARQRALDNKADRDGSSMQRAQRKKRPARLLSGLFECSECGGGFSMISATHYGCSNARNKGEAICSNRKSIHAGKLEERVLETVRTHLMAPELVEAFSKEYRKQLHELSKKRVSARSLMERELSDVETQISKLVDSIAAGVPAGTVAPKITALNDRKGQIEDELATLGAEPEVHIHPDLSAVYRRKVEELADALQHDATQSQAQDLIRSLIEKIVMTLQKDGSLVPVVHGDLAGILSLCDMAQNTKPALSAEERASQVKLVAGAGFEPATFRL